MSFQEPLRERDFALLFAGTLVSLIGDGIYLVALPFAVLAHSTSAAMLSVAGVAWSVGLLGFVLTGGVLADRIDRRRVLVAADGLRLLALVGAAALTLTHRIEIGHLIALAGLYGAGEGLGAPALSVLVPDVVSDEDLLLRANALMRALRPIALRLVGPALGGLTVATLGTGGAMLVDAGTFAASVACIAAIHTRPRAVAPAAGSAADQLRQAAAFVRSQSWLWATLVLAAVALLAYMGPVEVLLPFRVKHELGGTAGSFGMVLAAIGVGCTIGSLSSGQRGLPGRPLTFLYCAWAGATFMLCGYALAEHIWQIALFGVVAGLCSGAGDPVWSTLMQTRVPVELRGRVASMDWLVSIGLAPISFALVGPIAAVAGTDRTLLAAGAAGGALALALLYAVTGLREQAVSDAEALPSRP